MSLEQNAPEACHKPHVIQVSRAVLTCERSTKVALLLGPPCRRCFLRYRKRLLKDTQLYICKHAQIHAATKPKTDYGDVRTC